MSLFYVQVSSNDKESVSRGDENTRKMPPVARAYAHTNCMLTKHSELLYSFR